VAERIGADPDTELYPSLVVAVAMNDTRVATNRWVATNRTTPLSTLLRSAFDQLSKRPPAAHPPARTAHERTRERMTDQPAPPLAAEAGTEPLSHRQVQVIFSGLMLGMFLAAIDQTIVATALPTIVGELGGLNHLSWVVTSYLLATTVSTPLYGKLGDLYGRKRLFQAAIVIFLVGSVLCGLSSTMGQLIAFRAIQGVGGGGLLVLAQSIIADVVSPRERGRYQGYFGAVFGASSVLGPLLGGFFTDNLSWRWVFYVNIPLAIVALFVTAAVLPASVKRAGAKIDYVGATLLTAAISGIVLLTTWGGTEHAWTSPTIIGLGVGSLVLVAVFLWVETKVSEPILPLRLFRIRVFNVSGSASFIVGVAMFGAISFLPLFLQVVNGASATSSGLSLVPLMVGLLGASILVGRQISKDGRYRRYPIFGTAVAAVGLYLLSTMGTGTSTVTAGAFMVVLGIGIGSVMQVLVLATQNAVPIADLGVATSSVSFFRSVGGSVGVAVFGALFNNRLIALISASTSPADAEELLGGSITPESVQELPEALRVDYVDAFADALTDVFLYAVPVVLVAFALTWLLKEVPLRGRVDPDDPARELAAGSAPGTAAPSAMIH
jgi:EmrB/QacA subfamily drug resistance transporter